MKTYLILVSFLLLTANVFSQEEHKYVKLSEVKKGKRLTLYATNTDSISYDVFLRVVTEDYRRSSNRPTIKNVPPNSKVALITLIQLVGSAGKYEPTFVVNEVAQTLEVNKNHTELDLRLDKAIKNAKATLFISDYCSICPETKRILGDNNIEITEYNIDKDASKYLKAVEDLQTDKKPITTTFPHLMVKDKFHKNIKSVEEFIGILRKSFN